MRKGSLISFVLLASLAASGFAQNDGYYQAGQLKSILTDGATLAPVKKGISCVVTIKPDNSAGPANFEVKGTGWSSAAKLDLGGLTYAAGSLSAEAKLQNSSGSPLEGLRVDVASVIETYHTKDKEGKDIIATRAQTVELDSPAYLGDLDKGEASDAVSMKLGGIKIAPETDHIDVTYVVSGLRYVGQFSTDVGTAIPWSIDVEADGSVLVPSNSNPELYRYSADGKSATKIAGFGEQRFIYSAVDPKTGTIYITTSNANGTIKLSKSGEKIADFPGGEEGFGNWTHTTRIDGQGNFWVEHSSIIHRYTNGKETLAIDNEGHYFEGYAGFDVDAKGRCWVACKEGILRFDADGKTKKVIAKGHDANLGGMIINEQSVNVRMDPQGNAWVCEENHGNPEVFPRATIFDSEGRFVRSFGRGARSAPEANSSNLGGFANVPHDVAFGKNGIVYVAVFDDHKPVMMFEPF